MKNTVNTSRQVQFYTFPLIAFTVCIATAKYAVAALLKTCCPLYTPLS
jgi:hypothetical protein